MLLPVSTVPVTVDVRQLVRDDQPGPRQPLPIVPHNSRHFRPPLSSHTSGLCKKPICRLIARQLCCSDVLYWPAPRACTLYSTNSPHCRRFGPTMFSGHGSPAFPRIHAYRFPVSFSFFRTLPGRAGAVGLAPVRPPADVDVPFSNPPAPQEEQELLDYHPWDRRMFKSWTSGMGETQPHSLVMTQ